MGCSGKGERGGQLAGAGVVGAWDFCRLPCALRAG